MKFLKGAAPFIGLLTALPFCVFANWSTTCADAVDSDYYGDAVDWEGCTDVEDDSICEEDCYPQDACQEEQWCRYICYEPKYYTVQKCIEKQVPTKRKKARLVPKQYTVQRIRYIPEYFNEVITKNEVEYYYVDDWKTCTEMVTEQKCEWVPKYYWKKSIDDCQDIAEEYYEEVQQDE